MSQGQAAFGNLGKRIDGKTLGAHFEVDKAVDAAYGKKNFASDAERVAFLFELYHEYTSLLLSPEKPKQHKRKKSS